MNENETFESTESAENEKSFMQEVGRGVALNVAVAAGTFAVITTAGHVMNFVQKKRNERAAKKLITEIENTPDTEE